MDRLVPARKDRPINLDLPPIHNMQQISEAMTKIVAAIADGQITPTEGEVLANFLSVQTTVVSVADLERRVEQLEAMSAEKPAQLGIQVQFVKPGESTADPLPSPVSS
jgi:hypothetical protein